MNWVFDNKSKSESVKSTFFKKMAENKKPKHS